MDESRESSDVKGRLFNLEDKLRSKKYNSDFAVEMRGKDVNVSYFQANGFPYPLLIKDKTGLGLRVPSENFTVSDIKRCVGSKRIVDVMDTETEVHQDMSMKEWVRYYENKERIANLNVTNLEFTNTKLETYVEQPEVVRLIDWVHHAWPLYSHDYHSDDQQPTTTAAASLLPYPKMQRYCIMTVAKSYTDFHINMAGSSVWYHILHGKKTMWLVPPTEANFELYKKWIASDSKPFFADSVAACQRINLETGWTILIPSGWIHSIYTAEDSLSFAGNFLHSFSIQDQLRVYQMEGSNDTQVNACSPYFNELHWYVLEGYVHAVSDIRHRIRSEEEISLEKEEEDAAELKQGLSNEDGEEIDQKKFSDCKKADSCNDPDSPKRTPSSSKSGSKSSTPSRNPQGQDPRSRSKASSMSSLMKSVTVKLENCLLATEAGRNQGSLGGPTTGEGRAPRGWIHLTTFELDGLKAILEYLEGLPSERQKVPLDIRDPIELIKDLKMMLSNHCKDNPKLAITGQPVLMLPGRKKLKAKMKAKPMSKSSADGSSFIRRRRVRCKKCEPCTRSECGECPFCKDMKKFGGLGRMKQTCISRQCMAPILPTAAVCVICEKGDASTSSSTTVGGNGENRGTESSSPLMECGICWKILHPSCLHQKYPDLSNEGILNEDLPNSWECPRCCDLGKQGQLKPRVVKGLGFVLKQRQECQNVMSSSDESDDNSYEQEKITAETNKTPVSVTGKKPGSIKRKQPTEKEGMQKNRKKKSMSEVRDLEPPTKKIMMDVSTLKEEKPKAKLSLNNGQEAFVGESSTLQLPPSAPVMQQAQDPLYVMAGRNLESQTPSSTGGGRISDAHTDLRMRDHLSYPTPFPPTIPKVAVNKYVVRPAPIPPPPKNVPLENGSMHPLDRDLWIRVFRSLSPLDLAKCMSVSKTFNRWCYDRRLWYAIDVSWCQIKQAHLIGIVRRQPKRLNLSWTNISHRQLLWMLNRLPHLKHLNVAGNSWPAVSSLCCCAYPFLLGLNVSWVAGVQDACIRDLLSPPIDRRPGVDPSIRHLDRCTDLRLAGSDITNSSLELIVTHLNRLKRLDISYCVAIDDRGIEILADDKSSAQQTLRVLIVASCSQLTPACLKHLDKLSNLEEVDLQGCPKISEVEFQEFRASHPLCRVKWLETGVKVIEDI